MAELTVQNVAEAGLEASYDPAAGGGDTFANDTSGRTFLHVQNGAGSDITVTITAQRTSVPVPGFGNATKSNAVVTVTAGEKRFIGPFPAMAYNDADGLVHVGYSSATSVTVAALKLPAV